MDHEASLPLLVAVRAAPNKQISLTDPDARSMATTSKDTGLVGYNVQVVDAQHHLIVAHEVANIGNDRSQLSTMAKQAQEATGVCELTAIANRGYFKGEEILACETTAVTPPVPKPLTSGAKADGWFGKQDFVCDAGEDAYRCAAGEKLTWRYWNVEAGRKLHNYWTTKCAGRALKSNGTPGKERRQALGATKPPSTRSRSGWTALRLMRVRRQAAEHPFAPSRRRWARPTSACAPSKRVSAEMSLHVLAYSLKRMIGILGVQPLIWAISAASASALRHRLFARPPREARLRWSPREDSESAHRRSFVCVSA